MKFNFTRDGQPVPSTTVQKSDRLWVTTFDKPQQCNGGDTLTLNITLSSDEHPEK